MNSPAPVNKVKDRRSVVMALVLAAIAMALYVFGFYVLR